MLHFESVKCCILKIRTKIAPTARTAGGKQGVFLFFVAFCRCETTKQADGFRKDFSFSMWSLSGYLP
ncbi:hypothetical protein D0T85_03875 [Bacteroides sp. 519]|nr:hypothetical protein [Bacteroides sp. 519]